MPPNFYFDQQELLEERSKGKPWSWTALRPHTVIGYAVGNPLNLLSGLAVYAAISKELGLPLRFPGTRECYSRIMQATDSGLLARSMAWAATTPACAGQAYNITNGDFFRWESLWPKLARAFDMPVGPVQTLDLAVMMADKAPLWDAMVKKYDLRKIAYDDAANWRFMNYAFRVDWDAMSDTLKCRRDGFLEFMDTEAMYLRLIEELRAARFIP
jgi:nucleoside-diphosphate-sugar epimerase